MQSDTKARMMRLTDPYLRERMHDFDDLANRLLRQLIGFSPHSAAEGFPNDAIVFARAMGAAELLDYPRANLRGLVLEEGAVTSHVVIVARAMGIAVVGQATGRWRSPKTVTPSSSTATTARCMCARLPICRRL